MARLAPTLLRLGLLAVLLSPVCSVQAEHAVLSEAGAASAGEASGDPYLGQASVLGNVLSLEVAQPSWYVQPGEAVVIDLDVTYLLQKVVGCQAMLGYSSTFLEAGPGCVAAGGAPWDDLIYNSWDVGSGVAGEIDTAIGVDVNATTTGTDADNTIAIITLAAQENEGISQVVFRPDVSDVESTMLADMNAQPVYPITIDSRDIVVDGTDPTVENLTATQVSCDVLNCIGTTVQGIVDIAVDACDALAGLAEPPTVTVTQGVTALSVMYVGESPAGTFSYTVEIESTTANSTWVIEAIATDKAGNVGSTMGMLCVNKNTVTGTVAFDTLSYSYYGVTRDVVFVATDALGTVLTSWTVPVDFANSAMAAAGDYVLTAVPDEIAGLSAKTGWALRHKQGLTLGLNGQATLDFVGSELLHSGDVTNSNMINLLDYSVLRVNWLTDDYTADINGDGGVNLLDYSLMKWHWFETGAPQ